MSVACERCAPVVRISRSSSLVALRGCCRLSQSIQTEFDMRVKRAAEHNLARPAGLKTKQYDKLLAILTKMVAAGVSAAMVSNVWQYWWLQGGGQAQYHQQRERECHTLPPLLAVLRSSDVCAHRALAAANERPRPRRHSSRREESDHNGARSDRRRQALAQSSRLRRVTRPDGTWSGARASRSPVWHALTESKGCRWSAALFSGWTLARTGFCPTPSRTWVSVNALASRTRRALTP